MIQIRKNGNSATIPKIKLDYAEYFQPPNIK